MKKVKADLSLNSQNILFNARELNGYSDEKKNLYILIHSGDRDYEWVVKSTLSNELNIISLYYDLHNSYRINNFAKLIVAQLAKFIGNNKDSIIMGHSFNGYLAYQIACIVPQISFCVLIDTYNYFKTDLPAPNSVLETTKMVFNQVIKNKDYIYPLYLLKTLLNRLVSKRNIKDINFFKGIEYLRSKIKQNQYINNCIYFQASRSFPGIQDHGSSWKPYVRGNFFLVNLNANHLTILQKHSATIINYIEKIVLRNAVTDEKIRAD